MLRLPPFTHHRPTDVLTAVRLAATLRDEGKTIRWLAGGTDLLVNMKHRIDTPDHVLSISALPLSYIRETETEVVIGAATPLADIRDHPTTQERLSGLVAACRQIAGPQLQRMGTLGGNICLDTRCLYINQTAFWRRSLGYCLKKDGDLCHVVEGGRRCVAAAANDTVLPLWLYHATLIIGAYRGERLHERRTPLADFFVADGQYNKTLEPDELLLEVRVPQPAADSAVSFEKLRLRKSIDFPLANLALALSLPGDDAPPDQPFSLACVVGALGARPKSIGLTKYVPQGGSPAQALADPNVVAGLSNRIHAACRPLTNMAGDPDWRRHMLRPLFKRALVSAMQSIADGQAAGDG